MSWRIAVDGIQRRADLMRQADDVARLGHVGRLRPLPCARCSSASVRLCAAISSISMEVWRADSRSAAAAVLDGQHDHPARRWPTAPGRLRYTIHSVAPMVSRAAASLAADVGMDEGQHQAPPAGSSSSIRLPKRPPRVIHQRRHARRQQPAEEGTRLFGHSRAVLALVTAARESSEQHSEQIDPP